MTRSRLLTSSVNACRPSSYAQRSTFSPPPSRYFTSEDLYSSFASIISCFSFISYNEGKRVIISLHIFIADRVSDRLRRELVPYLVNIIIEYPIGGKDDGIPRSHGKYRFTKI